MRILFLTKSVLAHPPAETLSRPRRSYSSSNLQVRFPSPRGHPTELHAPLSVMYKASTSYPPLAPDHRTSILPLTRGTSKLGPLSFH